MTNNKRFIWYNSQRLDWNKIRTQKHIINTIQQSQYNTRPILGLLIRLIKMFQAIGDKRILKVGYIRYCQSVMIQKLFSTAPGTFMRAERKEATDGLERIMR